MAGAVPPELYAPSNQQSPLDTLNANSFFPQPQSALASPSQVSPWSMPTVGPAVSLNQSPSGGKYYTIQRVNGNGGNGKSDGVAGPHKHTLEESDRVKKNSVIRWMAKNEKDKKKTQVSLECFLNLDKFYRMWCIYLGPGKTSILSRHSRCGEPRKITEICGAPCIFLFGGSVTVKYGHKSSPLPPSLHRVHYFCAQSRYRAVPSHLCLHHLCKPCQVPSHLRQETLCLIHLFHLTLQFIRRRNCPPNDGR